jgi:hypothetical protein
MIITAIQYLFYFCGEFQNVILMQLNYVYKQYDDYYVGHLVEFPEYDTQGKTIEELELMLKSLYADLNSFEDVQFSTPFQYGVLELV